MLIAHTNPAIVRINAIQSIDSAHHQIAPHAAKLRRMESDSALKIAGAGIGIAKRAKDTRKGNVAMQIRRRNFSYILAENVSIAALAIGAFWKLTILTHLKNYVLLIGNIQHKSGFYYGRKRKIIYKSFVLIAIALKHMPNHGLSDIACKRIEEAYKQPDFFVEPPTKPKQESML